MHRPHPVAAENIAIAYLSNHRCMRYYLLPDQHGYKILKVQPEDAPLFQKRYEKEILCQADSLGELLLQFAAMLERPTPKAG